MTGHKQQFPFLIAGTKRHNRSSYQDIIRFISDCQENIEGIQQNITALLKKVGYLESALDDFFNQKNPDEQLMLFFKSFIPILDRFDALRSAVEAAGSGEWKEGVTLFHEKLLTLLKTYGCIASAERGMKFDPSLHEAVDTEKDSLLTEGLITRIIENGWVYKSNVVRFARVIVSRKES
jgi:hypothetical protein